MEVEQDRKSTLTANANSAPMTPEQVQAILDDPDVCECCKADLLDEDNRQKFFGLVPPQLGILQMMSWLNTANRRRDGAPSLLASLKKCR